MCVIVCVHSCVFFVCVCVCARARARVCMCVCVRARATCIPFRATASVMCVPYYISPTSFLFSLSLSCYFRVYSHLRSLFNLPQLSVYFLYLFPTAFLSWMPSVTPLKLSKVSQTHAFVYTARTSLVSTVFPGGFRAFGSERSTVLLP